MMNNRLLFCAPSSGGGKTSVVCAILQAIKNRGLTPVDFKCGPDYIDPMFHSEIIGTNSRNLDLFFMGDEVSKYLLRENGRDADISIIEGVMGYYDGIAMSSEASAYDLATVTQTPSVLIVDARGRALSVAALVHGFMSFRENSNIRGVILNRISPMMYPRLKQAIEENCNVPVFGFLPECPQATLESRHLGLVTAKEVDNLREKLMLLADLCEKHIDLDGLMALSKTAPEILASLPALPQAVENRPKIAVAKDKAFCFYYADSLELMQKLGAEIVSFSPMDDEKLPDGISGLYFGGGYPELYAEKLSGNKSMLEDIKTAIEGGMPTIAECGGFMYLHRSMEADDGNTYDMVGAVDAHCYKTPRLSRFGYITITAKHAGLLGEEGFSMPAHEFHYWDSEAAGTDFAAVKPLATRKWDCAIMTDTLYAGFPHFHFYACPTALEKFLLSCESYAR